MRKHFIGLTEDIAKDLAASGITHGIDIGRRAPMHKMHTDCIREMADAGLRPVIVIGSCNAPDSPCFDPLRNPLTLEQQKAQLKAALPDLYDQLIIVAIKDYPGDDDAWLSAIAEALAAQGVPPEKALLHLRGKAADAQHMQDKIKPLSAYAESFIARGFGVWQSHNRDVADDFINASDYRDRDLTQLTPAERAVLAAPALLIETIEKARAANPAAGLLAQYKIPPTTLDLSLDRLRRECGIDSGDIIRRAREAGEVTVATLAACARALLTESLSARPHFGRAAACKSAAPATGNRARRRPG